MSALQDGSLALRANVLFASTALRLEPILDRCYNHILGTAALLILCIPETALLANVDLRWSALRVLMGSLGSVYLPWEFFDAGFRRRLWIELKSLSDPRISNRLFAGIIQALRIRSRGGAKETSQRNSDPQVSRGKFPILTRLSDADTRSRAYRLLKDGILWTFAVRTLFRVDSPWRLSETNWLMLLVYPRPEYLWMYLVHYVLIAMFSRGPRLRLLIRITMWLLRLGRIAWYFIINLFEIFDTAAVIWVRSNADRIVWVIGWCVGELVFISIFDAVFWGAVFLLVGPSDGTWRQYGFSCWTKLAISFVKSITTGQWKTFPGRRRLRSISNHEMLFSYTELNHERNIRLLVLYPRTKDDDIVCSLFQIPLDQTPCYEAISYRWNPSTEMRNIRVNGRRLEITPSAHKVLANRSSFWRPRLLWIDSICINQKDDESNEENNEDESSEDENSTKISKEKKSTEKEQQLKLMGDIYWNAFLVTVCLQLPDTPFDAVTKSVEKKFRTWGVTVPEGAFDEVMERVEAFAASDILEEVAYLDLHEDQKDLDIYRKYATQVRGRRWIAFQRVVRNPWFDRMWVVQEVSLASRIRVLYGRTEIQWKCLAAALSRAITYPAIGSLLTSTKDPITRHFEPTGVANIQRIINFQNKIAESKDGSISFVSTLFECDTFKSSDPRDKIFGIQGFCKGNIDSKIIPNYKKSTVKVYLATAKHLLKQDNPLRLLSYAGIGYFATPNPKFRNEKYQRPVAEGLPSWCPDWSRRPRLGILSYRNSTVFLSAYRAGGGDDAKREIGDSSQSRTLVLMGREVDTISSLGPQLGIQRKERDTEKEADENEATETWEVSELKNQGEAVRESWKIILSSVDSDCGTQLYPYTNPNQKLRDVFWRTLSGDRTQTHRPAPASCRAEFKQWISFQNYMVDTDVYSAISGDPETPLPPELLGGYGSAKFGLLFTNCGFGRRLCITKRGYIGAAPPFAREGDIIYLIQGAQVPFVLRSAATIDPGSNESSSNSFELVGEAYVHGIMDGEFYGRDEVPSWRDVNLV